jgi:ABC-type branched-subunit amino acid transport system permease subunit
MKIFCVSIIFELRNEINVMFISDVGAVVVFRFKLWFDQTLAFKTSESLVTPVYILYYVHIMYIMQFSRRGITTKSEKK